MILDKKPTPPTRLRKPSKPYLRHYCDYKTVYSHNIGYWSGTLTKSEVKKITKILNEAKDPRVNISNYKFSIDILKETPTAIKNYEAALIKYEERLAAYKNADEIYQRELSEYKIKMEIWKNQQKVKRISELRKELDELGGL